jgi:hypothetical protein
MGLPQVAGPLVGNLVVTEELFRHGKLGVSPDGGDQVSVENAVIYLDTSGEDAEACSIIVCDRNFSTIASITISKDILVNMTRTFVFWCAGSNARYVFERAMGMEPDYGPPDFQTIVRPQDN